MLHVFFKQNRFLIGVCILLLSFNSRAQEIEVQESYRIKIDRQNPKIAQVDYRTVLTDSLLYMSPVGAHQFASRWANFVHHIEAKTPAGDNIRIDSLDGAKWKVHAPKGMKLTLSYQVHLEHEDHEWSGGVDGAAYSTDWGVFYTGRSIFIMNGNSKKHIEVDFDIPDHWQVSTPWISTLKSPFQFLVDTQTALSDSMFFAGLHEEIVLSRDGFELIFVLGGKQVIAQKKSLTDMAIGIMDYYINLFGAVPNPSPANKFARSLVVLNSSNKTDGEVIGNNISILLEENGDDMSQLIGRFIFAHEFFHLWNGKSFAPSANDCEWFKEGITNYYTLKSLFHVGFLNESSFLNTLDKFFYTKYINDPGLGKLSMTQGDQKHAHWGLIYSGGLFAGIAQDMVIRTSTDNRLSLDTVMKELFQKYGGTNDTYTLTELREIMSKTSGIDQSAFFNKYITGTEPIPLQSYLNRGGFEAEEKNGSLSVLIKKNRSSLEKKMNYGFFGLN